MSLNLSFVLYLCVYLPQIIHNRKPYHLSNLSIGMHCILYASYCLDLIYGFSSDLQWQYKTVSVVGLTLLSIQHLQITYHQLRQKKGNAPRHPKRSERSLGDNANLVPSSIKHFANLRRSFTTVRIMFNLTLLFTITGLIIYFFLVKQIHLPKQTTQTIGYLSRAGFLIYTLPQIMKNHALKSADAISIPFIYLSLVLSVLDMTSAWCLNWGWPNKLGSPLTMLLLCVMLIQIKQYDVIDQFGASWTISRVS